MFRNRNTSTSSISAYKIIVDDKIIVDLYDLFKQDKLINEMTDILWDFMRATWKMQSNFSTQLKEKLIERVINLVNENRNTKSSSPVILNLVRNTVNDILKPFCSTEKNDLLYESIVREWFKLSWLPKDYFTKKALTRLTYRFTEESVELLTGLNKHKKESLTNELYLAKIEFLHEVTGLYPTKEDRIAQKPIRLDEAIGVVLLITMAPAFLMQASNEMLVYIAFVAVVFALAYVTFFNSRLYENYMQNKVIELKPITDYLVSDKLLDSIEKSLEKILNDRSNDKSKNENEGIKIGKKEKKRFESTLEQNQHDYTFGNTNQQNQNFDRLKNVQITIKEKRKTRREEMKSIMKKPEKTNKLEDSKKNKIIWEFENKKYNFDPVNTNCKVKKMYSDDQYLKQQCKNDYLICDYQQVLEIVKDKDMTEKMIKLLDDPHVVTVQNSTGLVRVSDDEYKVKQLYTGYSHNRLFLKLVATAKITEDGKEVNKNLYMATKLTNQ